MLLHQKDNRDPRWTPEIDAAIEKKVSEAMAFAPRLELSADGKTPNPEKDRKVLLTTSFREIVKATSIDTLMTAPPALLEQLSVLAVVNNENVKGILVQVIRVYMMLWGTPETNEYARQLLLDMEAAAREKLSQIKDPKPERLRWAPMPC
jgi:hypothetical protein